MHRYRLALVLGAFLALAAETGPLVAQKSHDTYQRALAAERAEGRLNDAIVLYQQAIKEAAADRGLAARAWIRIGECYRMLGDAQARAVFERVARDFNDMPVESAEARARLEALATSSPAEGTGPRLVGVHAGDVDFQTLMADGRPAGTDWTTGDLIARDPTGRITRLAAGAGYSAWGEYPVLSADRRQIAYGWFDAKLPGFGHQLRLIPNQAGAATRVLVDGQPRLLSPRAIAWSKDGRSILATFEVSEPGQPRNQDDKHLVWVSATDGSIRVIRTFESWRSTRSNGCCLGTISLSPDGRFVAYAVPREANSRGRSVYVLDLTKELETEVVQGTDVVNNEQPLWTPRGDALIYLTNRAGFGVWSLPMSEGKATGAPRAVRPQSGPVKLLGFNESGVLVYTHSPNVRQVLVADIGPDGRVPEGRVHQTDSLVGDVAAWSLDGSMLAIKRGRDDTGREDDRRDVVVWFAADRRERVFRPVDRMGIGKPSWFPGNVIQPISSGTLRLRVERGELREERIATAIPLGAATPDGATVYAPTNPAAPASRGIAVYDVASGQRRREIRVPDGFDRLALSPNGRTLALVTSGTEGRVARIGVDGSDYRVLYTGSIAMSEINWSADGSAILFLEYRAPRTRLMRVSATGGSAEAVGLETAEPFRFDVSPDGKRFVDSSRSESLEVWTLNLSATPKQ